MVNGELLRQLFKGYARHDEAAFAFAASEIVREERLKNHRLLADDLERILRGSNGSLKAGSIHRLPDIPRDGERGFPLFTIDEFDYSWERLIVSGKTMRALEQIMLEYQKQELLASAGLRPKQKVLFYGPPGCGKTLAAKVLAAAMNRPLIVVRFDAVISSYLGETAANLRKVFDFIERGQWVVLFDEFDAIGKERDNPYEHGELKRVVNSLLQLMDAYRGDSLLVAATNHENLLDTAIWRRFEGIIAFPPPTLQDRVLMLRTFLGGVDTSRLKLESVARKLNGATGADVERVAIEATRRAVLEGRKAMLQEDTAVATADFRSRFNLSMSLQTIDELHRVNKNQNSADADIGAED